MRFPTLPAFDGCVLTPLPPRNEDHEVFSILVAHLATGRQFDISVLELEAILEEETFGESQSFDTKPGVFFAFEHRPEATISSGSDPEDTVMQQIEIPGDVALSPSACWRFVNDLCAKMAPRDGVHSWEPTTALPSPNSRPIFYPSLSETLRMIRCALDADCWFSAAEPTRSLLHPDFPVTGPLEGWTKIRSSNALEHFELILSVVCSALQPGHRVSFEEWNEPYVFLQVLDPSLKSPESCRFICTYDYKRRMVDPGNLGCYSYRSGYKSLALHLIGPKSMDCTQS
jgi:hypothetical protein